MSNLNEDDLLKLMMSGKDSDGISDLDGLLKQEQLNKKEEEVKKQKQEEKFDVKPEKVKAEIKSEDKDAVALVKNRIRLLKESFKGELKDVHLSDCDKFRTIEEYQDFYESLRGIVLGQGMGGSSFSLSAIIYGTGSSVLESQLTSKGYNCEGATNKLLMDPGVRKSLKIIDIENFSAVGQDLFNNPYKALAVSTGLGYMAQFSLNKSQKQLDQVNQPVERHQSVPVNEVKQDKPNEPIVAAETTEIDVEKYIKEKMKSQQMELTKSDQTGNIEIINQSGN